MVQLSQQEGKTSWQANPLYQTANTQGAVKGQKSQQFDNGKGPAATTVMLRGKALNGTTNGDRPASNPMWSNLVDAPMNYQLGMQAGSNYQHGGSSSSQAQGQTASQGFPQGVPSQGLPNSSQTPSGPPAGSGNNPGSAGGNAGGPGGGGNGGGGDGFGGYGMCPHCAQYPCACCAVCRRFPCICRLNGGACGGAWPGQPCPRCGQLICQCFAGGAGGGPGGPGGGRRPDGGPPTCPNCLFSPCQCCATCGNYPCTCAVGCVYCGLNPCACQQHATWANGGVAWNPQTTWMNDHGQAWWRKDRLGILGPPVNDPTPADQTKERLNQKSKIEPVPEFPKDLKHESYKRWRIKFTSWIWDQRNLGICESLFAQPLKKAFRDTTHFVGKKLELIDPRLMAWPGRKKGTHGPWDPGELSGTVWFIQGLDFHHWRDENEEGFVSIDKFEKTRHEEGKTMLDYIQEFETNYIDAQMRAGYTLGNVGRTRQFLLHSRLNADQRSRLMERVNADMTKFDELQYWAKTLYPFDKSLLMEGAMKINATFPAPDATPDGGHQQADPYANIDIFAFSKGKGKPWNKGTPTHWGHAVQDQKEWNVPAPTYAVQQQEYDGWEEPIYQAPPGYDPCEVYWNETLQQQVLDIPTWYQDFFSGAWLNNVTNEVFECTDSEVAAWEAEAWDDDSLMDSLNPRLNEDEPAEETMDGTSGMTPGVYFLPVYLGKGKGNRKGRSAKKGRKGRPMSKGRRPKGGVKGACHLCGKQGHWKNQCNQRKGAGGRSTKGGKGRVYAFGKGGGKDGDKGKGKCFNCGEEGHWQNECPKRKVNFFDENTGVPTWMFRWHEDEEEMTEPKQVKENQATDMPAYATNITEVAPRPPVRIKFGVGDTARRLKKFSED